EVGDARRERRNGASRAAERAGSTERGGERSRDRGDEGELRGERAARPLWLNAACERADELLARLRPLRTEPVLQVGLSLEESHGSQPLPRRRVLLLFPPELPKPLHGHFVRGGFSSKASSGPCGFKARTRATARARSAPELAEATSNHVSQSPGSFAAARRRSASPAARSPARISPSPSVRSASADQGASGAPFPPVQQRCRRSATRRRP